MSLAQGQIYAKDMPFFVPIGFVRFARYCGKMYSCHLFPYGGLLVLIFCQANLFVKNALDLYDQAGLLDLDLVVKGYWFIP